MTEISETFFNEGLRNVEFWEQLSKLLRQIRDTRKYSLFTKNRLNEAFDFIYDENKDKVKYLIAGRSLRGESSIKNLHRNIVVREKQGGMPETAICHQY